jgi:uncharacterized protein (DUF362 family)
MPSSRWRTSFRYCPHSNSDVLIEPNVLTGSRGRPASARSPAVRQVVLGLVETVQPTKDIGDAIADLPSDSNSGWAATVGAQVVDRLQVHTEILDELAGL